MANWFGDPREFSRCEDGFMFNTKTPVEIDPSWLPGHEDENKFCKFNAEILTIIHEEKRLPTKDEVREAASKYMPPEPLDWNSLTDSLPEIENLWGEIEGIPSMWTVAEPLTFGEVSPTTYVTPDDITLTGTSNYTTTYGEPVPFELKWEDFVKDEGLKGTAYHNSALASVAGVTVRNLDHPLL